MGSILIKNGRVWDGYRFFDSDVLVEESIVTKIGTGIECSKAFVFDAAGMTVLPGLVDAHAHFSGPEPDLYGINPEMSCLPFGVTAAADAGGAHADLHLVSNYGVKNVTFVTVPIKDDKADFAPAGKKMQLYGDSIIGLKVYFDANKPDVRSSRPLAEVCEYARSRNLKVMVHCSNSPTPMEAYLPLLSPGDILTHAYHGGINTARDDSFASILTAKKRGVVIDAGFAGHIHTDFSVFRAAIAKGVLPDTISTDITRASAYKRGGRYGMTMCLSIAKTAGMKEADVFRAVTSSPAKVLGKEGVWGVLKEGHCADIAVLEYGNEPFSLTDKAGNTLEDTKGYRCKLTVAGGVVVWRD